MMHLKPTNGTHQPFPSHYFESAPKLTELAARSSQRVIPGQVGTLDRDVRSHGAPWAYALDMAAIRRANENRKD